MHTNNPLYVLSKTKRKISKIFLFFADVSKKSAKNAKFYEKYGPTSNGHNILLSWAKVFIYHSLFPQKIGQ